MRDDAVEEQSGAAEAAPENAQTQPAAGDAERAGAGAEGTSPQGELDALKDRYLRLAAEFENYRRRTDRERADLQDRAQAQLVKRLLDALDDLQRVAHFNAETTSVPALLEGVQMVERKLLRALESAGLETVEAHGQTFNPEHHEALMMAPTEDRAEDESVGEVFQQGYRFKGELLRPARVTVRRFGG